MPIDLDHSFGGDASFSSTGNQNPSPRSTVKKKRNLPGMPDPEAEVIALSPKTLMATNRFVCEICNKGFQRDQNLQLHRRGHNLPFNLKQISNKEAESVKKKKKKKVYVCPVSGCVHHDPSRALGDLTGIKKHFSRKHGGDKKLNCENCSKKYAVVSDLKAHLKICGSKDYKCDCGTLFSRKDSFATHRAFCNALVEEKAKNRTQRKKLYPKTDQKSSSPAAIVVDSPQSVETETDKIVSCSVLPIQESQRTIGFNVSSSSSLSNDQSIYAGLYASSSSTASPSLFESSSSMEPISLCLSTNSSFYEPEEQPFFVTPLPPQPAISATALLQKAAQMGSTGSGGSLLRGLGIVSTSSSSAELSNASLASGLALGLPCYGSGSESGLKELMMERSSSVFGPKHTTLDFLGLGRAVGNGSGLFGSSGDIGRNS